MLVDVHGVPVHGRGLEDRGRGAGRRGREVASRGLRKRRRGASIVRTYRARGEAPLLHDEVHDRADDQHDVQHGVGRLPHHLVQGGEPSCVIQQELPRAQLPLDGPRLVRLRVRHCDERCGRRAGRRRGVGSTTRNAPEVLEADGACVKAGREGIRSATVPSKARRDARWRAPRKGTP